MLYATPPQDDPRQFTYFYDQHTLPYVTLTKGKASIDLNDVMSVIQNCRTNCNTYSKTDKTFVTQPIMGTAKFRPTDTYQTLFYTKYTNFSSRPDFTSFRNAAITILPVGTTHTYGRGKFTSIPIIDTYNNANPFDYNWSSGVNRQGPIHPTPFVFRGVAVPYNYRVDFPYMVFTLNAVGIKTEMNIFCNFYGPDVYLPQYTRCAIIEASDKTFTNSTTMGLGALTPKNSIMYSYGMGMWASTPGALNRVTGLQYSYPGPKQACASVLGAFPIDDIIELTDAICLINDGDTIRAVFMEAGIDFDVSERAVGSAAWGGFLGNLPKLYLDAPLQL